MQASPFVLVQNTHACNRPKEKGNDAFAVASLSYCTGRPVSEDACASDARGLSRRAAVSARRPAAASGQCSTCPARSCPSGASSTRQRAWLMSSTGSAPPQAGFLLVPLLAQWQDPALLVHRQRPSARFTTLCAHQCRPAQESPDLPYGVHQVESPWHDMVSAL